MEDINLNISFHILDEFISNNELRNWKLIIIFFMSNYK